VEGIVKWFNGENGFVFVAVAGGSEALIHIRQLETAGHSTVAEGARVKVRLGQGRKGPEVTEVIQVDTGAARVASTVERHPARVSKVVGGTEESIGTVAILGASDDRLIVKAFGISVQ
jgi:CspA family cold shock protein